MTPSSVPIPLGRVHGSHRSSFRHGNADGCNRFGSFQNRRPRGVIHFWAIGATILKTMTIHALTGVAALVGMYALAAPAHAQDGNWYAVARAGEATNTSLGSADFSDGAAYGAGIGTKLGPVRVEVDADHLSGSLSSAVDGSAWDYNTSAFLDFKLGDKSALSIGGGADYVQATATAFGSSFDTDGTGYHYSVGLSRRISDGVIAEVEWRRIEANLDVPFGSGDLETTVVRAGVRVTL